jgi:hypothetical protein
MGDRESAVDTTAATEALRATLKSQYHAALAMLRQAIEPCPDDAWFSSEHVNSSWQIAYHTLFFAHLYMQPTEADFCPWKHHQARAQYPDGIAGPADPDSSLPLLPEPYSKVEVLAYWDACDKMVEDAVDAVDVLSPESGFSWYKVSKLEHQIINISHIQHGAAQIADRLRSAVNVGVDWVGARRSGGPRATG